MSVTGILPSREEQGEGEAISWELTGNAGTDPTSNFLGTTDGEPCALVRKDPLVSSVDPLAHLHIVTRLPANYWASPARRKLL